MVLMVWNGVVKIIEKETMCLIDSKPFRMCYILLLSPAPGVFTLPLDSPRWSLIQGCLST